MVSEDQVQFPGSEQVLGTRCSKVLGEAGVPDPQSTWEPVGGKSSHGDGGTGLFLKPLAAGENSLIRCPALYGYWFPNSDLRNIYSFHKGSQLPLLPS